MALRKIPSLCSTTTKYLLGFTLALPFLIAAAAAAAVVVVLTDLPLLLFLMARAYGLWTLRLPQFQRRHQPKQPQTQDALK